MTTGLPDGSFRIWLILFAVCTLVGLLSFTGFYTQEILDKGTTPYRFFLVNEFTGAYSFYLLLPFILWFFRRFIFTSSNWPLMLPIHLIGSIITGIAHTLLMSFSRTLLYPIFNLGSYSMGDPEIRFLMEYQKQFLIYCSVLIVFYLIRYYRENRARERKTADLELQAAQLRTRLAESQLNTLKGQLQPHFLFNTLNMISSIMYDDVDKADRMISRLSTLLRMSLENADQQLVPLLTELEFLDAYQQIMEARFEGRIVFTQKVEPELLSAQVPAFFLQPLVENSIKHNSEKSENLNIQLEVKKQENRILVRLTDNGTGISGQFQKGFGLTSSEERLEQLYGDSYGIKYGNSPEGGFQVTVFLPLQSQRNPETAISKHDRKN